MKSLITGLVLTSIAINCFALSSETLSKSNNKIGCEYKGYIFENNDPIIFQEKMQRCLITTTILDDSKIKLLWKWVSSN